MDLPVEFNATKITPLVVAQQNFAKSEPNKDDGTNVFPLELKTFKHSLHVNMLISAGKNSELSFPRSNLAGLKFEGDQIHLTYTNKQSSLTQFRIDPVKQAVIVLYPVADESGKFYYLEIPVTKTGVISFHKLASFGNTIHSALLPAPTPEIKRAAPNLATIQQPDSQQKSTTTKLLPKPQYENEAGEKKAVQQGIKIGNKMETVEKSPQNQVVTKAKKVETVQASKPLNDKAANEKPVEIKSDLKPAVLAQNHVKLIPTKVSLDSVDSKFSERLPKEFTVPLPRYNPKKKELDKWKRKFVSISLTTHAKATIATKHTHGYRGTKPALKKKNIVRYSANKPTSDDKIFNFYLKRKRKKILWNVTPRIRPGMSLSAIFNDYRDYKIVHKISATHERTLDPGMVQSGHFIWKEKGKIITARSHNLIPLAMEERVIKQALQKRAANRSYPKERYLKQISSTLDQARKSGFSLDTKSIRRLRKILNRARKEFLANDRNLVLTPVTFSKLLTTLRSNVTYDYFKAFSAEEFLEKFNAIAAKQGRGKYTHAKITRIMGLHDTGRITANYNFKSYYANAIDKASAKYPSVPRSWIEEIIWIETKGDPKSISRAGAYGLMQLMPSVYFGIGEDKARRYALSFADNINPFNAYENIERGTAFLLKIKEFLEPEMKGFSSEQKKRAVYHAYNRGPSEIKRLLAKYKLGYYQHLPEETKKYFSRLGDFPRKGNFAQLTGK